MSAENKRAIGYVRWSSDEQADGDSLNRQNAAIESYCKRQGLQLVDTLIDEGLSASKGQHILSGKLGRFLIEADTGKYRGFAFVVEYLDRLSRLGITQTFALVERLRKAGIEIHEAQHNRAIRSLDDLGTAVMAVVDSYSAHEFSKKLSERIGKAWGSKKSNAGDGKPLTRNVPDWIRIEGRKYAGTKVVDPGHFVVIEERAAAVREAFRLAALNVSTKAIAEKINGGRSLTWLNRTLKSRTVLGEYQPRDGKKRAVGEPVQDFYPAIITQSEYDAARKALLSRRRGGRLTNRGDEASNLFAGLIHDVTDNDEPVTMWYLDTRTKSGRWQYLVSSWRAGRKQNRMRYKDFESAFLVFLNELDWGSVAGQTESDEQRKAQQQLDAVLSDIDKTTRSIEAKTKAMDDPDASHAVLSRLIAKDEARLNDLTAKKDALASLVDAAKSKATALYSPDSLLELIRAGTPQANDVRLRLRAEIKNRVERIDIKFNQTITQPNQTVCLVRFVNSAMRAIVFSDDGSMLLAGWTEPFDDSDEGDSGVVVITPRKGAWTPNA